MTGGRGITALATAWLLAVCATPLASQADSASPTPASMCFRGKPLPQCRGFWITESGLSGGPGFFLTGELGAMINTGSRSAFGGTLFVGADDDSYRWGIKGRYRYWLTSTTSLELAPGILLGGTDSLLLSSDPTGNYGLTQRFPGFTGHLGLNLADWFGVMAQLELIRGTGFITETPAGVNTSTGDATDVTGYVGVKLGSYAGVVGAVAVAVAFVIALSQLETF